jgi:ankyrin repeat protein
MALINEDEIFNYCKQGRLSKIVTYFEEGYNIEAKDENEDNLLKIASWYGHINIVKYLVKICKVNINSFDSDGDTSLSISSLLHFTNISIFLLEEGACIESSDYYGNTPLILASRYGNKEYTKILLLDFNANIDTKNNRGETSLIVSARLSYINIVKFLLKNGADYNLLDNDGCNVFSYLSEKDTIVAYNIIDFLNPGIKPGKR